MKSLAERRVERAARKRAELGLSDDYEFGTDELAGIGRDRRPSDLKYLGGNGGLSRR